MSAPTLQYRDGDSIDHQRARRTLVRAVVIVAVAAIAVVLGGIGVFAYISHQIHARMEAAQEHIPVVEARLAGDARWRDIQLYGHTQRNGSLLVSGGVASPGDLTTLQQIVQSTSPPVPVVWSVQVFTSPPTTTTTTISTSATQPTRDSK
jgi:hypothetical protein